MPSLRCDSVTQFNKCELNLKSREYSLHFRLGFYTPCLILDTHITMASSFMSDRFFLKQLKPESGNQHFSSLCHLSESS